MTIYWNRKQRTYNSRQNEIIKKILPKVAYCRYSIADCLTAKGTPICEGPGGGINSVCARDPFNLSRYNVGKKTAQLCRKRRTP
jgi:hypothetical protein